MRVGLVGCGRQGARRAEALLEGHDELVIAADVDIASAKALVRRYGCLYTRDWRDVVANPSVETVIICTPNDTHAPITIASAKKGKHALCEKPLARNVEEAQSMIKAVKTAKTTLKCGFTLRHHPGISQAKQWQESGTIGEIMHIRAVYGMTGRAGYASDWRMKREVSGGGQLMDQGMHVLDLARWFAGEFVEVSGEVATMYWKDAEVEDNAYGILRSKRKVIAFFHVSWTEWKNHFSLEVFGGDGYVKVEGLGGSYGVERAILGRRDFRAPFAEKIIEYRGQDASLVNEWREFVDAVHERRPPLGSGEDGLEAMRLARAIYASSRSRSTLRV